MSREHIFIASRCIYCNADFLWLNLPDVCDARNDDEAPFTWSTKTGDPFAGREVTTDQPTEPEPKENQ